MISTKLIGPALLPVLVLVVVVVLVLPPAVDAPAAAPEGDVPVATPDAPAAVDGRALAELEAPTTAPLDGAALEVVVVVVEVPAAVPALRMSIKATVWP